MTAGWQITYKERFRKNERSAKGDGMVSVDLFEYVKNDSKLLLNHRQYSMEEGHSLNKSKPQNTLLGLSFIHFCM